MVTWMGASFNFVILMVKGEKEEEEVIVSACLVTLVWWFSYACLEWWLVMMVIGRRWRWRTHVWCWLWWWWWWCRLGDTGDDDAVMRWLCLRLSGDDIGDDGLLLWWWSPLTVVIGLVIWGFPLEPLVMSWWCWTCLSVGHFLNLLIGGEGRWMPV